MRIRALLPALALSVCAAAHASAQQATPPGAEMTAAPATGTQFTTDPGGEIRGSVTNEVSTTATRIPFSAEQVWQVLSAAYADIGIEVKSSDPATRTLGNVNFHPRGAINGRRVSEYLDCGNSNLGAPIADVYSVRMSIQSSVVPAGTGSTVQTRITAFARDMNGSSSTPVHCNSRGRLESYLQAALLQALGNAQAAAAPAPAPAQR